MNTTTNSPSLSWIVIGTTFEEQIPTTYFVQATSREEAIKEAKRLGNINITEVWWADKEERATINSIENLHKGNNK